MGRPLPNFGVPSAMCNLCLPLGCHFPSSRISFAYLWGAFSYLKDTISQTLGCRSPTSRVHFAYLYLIKWNISHLFVFFFLVITKIKHVKAFYGCPLWACCGCFLNAHFTHLDLPKNDKNKHLWCIMVTDNYGVFWGEYDRSEDKQLLWSGPVWKPYRRLHIGEIVFFNNKK